MCAPDIPDPPSPQSTAAAQNSSNYASANANTIANSGTVRNADGSTRTTDLRTIQAYDPYTDKYNPVFVGDVTETLGEKPQAIKDQNDAAKLNLATLANNQSSFLNDYMAKPFSYDTNAHETWAMGLYDKINGGELDRQRENVRSSLSNQGMKVGTPGYQVEMDRYENNREKARNQFLLDSFGQGFGAAKTTRDQPFNEINAMLSSSQINPGQFNPSRAGTVATTDAAGIINNHYGQQVNQTMAQYNANQSLLGGLMSGAGNLFALSDPDAKKDIERIGEGPHEDIGLYAFRYKGEPKSSKKHKGVMADEVQKVMPSAVKRGRDGLRRVDYNKVFALGAA